MLKVIVYNFNKFVLKFLNFCDIRIFFQYIRELELLMFTLITIFRSLRINILNFATLDILTVNEIKLSTFSDGLTITRLK